MLSLAVPTHHGPSAGAGSRTRTGLNMDIRGAPTARLPQEMEDKANAQLDNFANILEKNAASGSIAPRRSILAQAVQTPRTWRQATMFGCMPPRDLLLTVGHEILEATMSLRRPLVRVHRLPPLLERYLSRKTTDFRWEAAPQAASD